MVDFIFSGTVPRIGFFAPLRLAEDNLGSLNTVTVDEDRLTYAYYTCADAFSGRRVVDTS